MRTGLARIEGFTMWNRMFLFLVTVTHALSWDPDAGLIGSYTKRAGVNVIATSNQKDAHLVIDSNDSTQWTSAGCLPTQYVSHEDENLVLNSCQNHLCTASIGTTAATAATDGRWETSAHVAVANGKAELHVRLHKELTLRLLTLQGKFNGPTTITIDHGNTHQIMSVFTPQDNYHRQAVSLDNVTATGISLTSTKPFDLKELAALGVLGCVDRVVVDLGQLETIGSIRVRAWPGEETYYSRLLTSVDMQTWHKVADINPKVTSAQTFQVTPPVSVRYVAVEHGLNSKDWVKSYVWELDAFGSEGRWGPAPSASVNPNSLREMFGVNAIWGWGSRGPSTNLKPGQGAFLYNQIASHARNYHNLVWDIKRPGNKADYDQMAQGHGTNGQSWLNWDMEYNIWSNANLTVDASIQFRSDRFPPSVWSNPKQDAYQFGKDFAAHFGPTSGNGLVTTAEVGNEPWDYHHNFYATLLEGMAKGLKDGDIGIKVLPAAFQAHDKLAENPPWNANYIGSRVTPTSARYLDAVNGHFYSFVKKPDGTRVMSYPEDPRSEFNAMKNLIRWRDVNMPGKGVWVTEYGWDCTGAGQTCTYSECVSERAASVYAIRALLIMARLGIERATWFFYANLDNNECNPSAQHIFCRSGLTASKEFHFAKKKVFDIHKYFLDHLGDKHFLAVVKEDSDAYVYLLGDVRTGGTSAVATHVVGWRPIDDNDTSSTTVTFNLQAQPTTTKYITPDGLVSASTPSYNGGQWSVSLKSEPIIVEITNVHITDNTGIIG